MSNLNPRKAKEEIRNLLENLLVYDTQPKSQLKSPLDIKTTWLDTNLRVETTLQDLLTAKIFESAEASNSPKSKQAINRLTYLLNKILKDKLNLLEDNRAKNEYGRYQGIGNWKFTLKLWHSSQETAYIPHNLKAFDEHWNKVYKVEPTKKVINRQLPPRRHAKLYGYQDKWDRLVELLSYESREQIVCIEGMSGSGKTSLALEAAYYCLQASQDSNYPLSFDAVIFTSAQTNHLMGTKVMPKLLGAEQCVADIVRVMSQVLKLPLEASLDFDGQLRLLLKHLSRKLTLLIIDNLETATDCDAIANLICEFPETVKIILTSRVPFPQLNSCSITLTHLQPQAGTALIENLANKFQINLSSKQITWIYQKTGGLPLAINYLVAQIITTGMSEDLMSMTVENTPNDLLKFCFADLVRSLSLTPAYQYLLTAGLFSQFASIKAIAFINQATEETTSAHLQHLRDLYLLFWQDTNHYSLHSLTQEYLQLELERQPDYEAQLRDRQVQWYLQLVEPYRFLSADEWHDYQELETEWINLRSVIEWCIWCDRYSDVKNFWQGLKGFTRTLGYWTERKIWLDWLLNTAQQKEDWQMVAEAKFHFSQTLAHIDQTDASGEAMKLAQEAWELKEYCSAHWQLDLSLYITALYIRQQNSNSWQTAQQWCDRSRQLFDSLLETAPAYSEKKCQLAYYQGEIYTQCRQLEKALNTYQSALEIAKSNNHKRGIAYIRSRISIILIQQNKLNKARQELLLLLELTKQYQDRRSEALCYRYLATIAEKQEKLEEAKQYATTARESFNNLGMETEAAEIEKLLQRT